MTTAMREADLRNTEKILAQRDLFTAYNDDEAPPSATPAKPDPLIDEAREALENFPATVATAQEIRRQLGI